jgi:hypothetical protein
MHLINLEIKIQGLFDDFEPFSFIVYTILSLLLQIEIYQVYKVP